MNARQALAKFKQNNITRSADAPAAIHTPDSRTVDPQKIISDLLAQQRQDISSDVRNMVTEILGREIEASQIRATERDQAKREEAQRAVRATSRMSKVFTKVKREVDEELLAAEIDALAAWTLGRSAGVTPASVVERMAARKGADAYSERQIEHLRRSFRSDSLEDGGAWVAEEISAQMVEYRREALIPYRRASTVTLKQGTLKFPKQNSVPLVYWVGEQIAPTATKFKHGTQTMSLRKLAGLAVMTNESLAQIEGMRERFMNELQRSMGHELQRSFYFGTGTEYQPNGIYNQTADSQKIQRTKAGAASTYAEVLGDLVKMQVKLASDYGDGNGSFSLERAVWLMNHVTRGGLIKLLDGSSQYAFFSDMMAVGRLLGCEFDVTDATPRTCSGKALSGGSNSILGLIDYSQITLGQGRNVSVKVADQATLTDSSGATINLFTQDSTAVQSITSQDQILHYDRAATWLYDVDWMTI